MPLKLHLEHIDTIAEAIPPALQAPVAWARRWAADHGAPIAIVGGFVRDLLLGRRNDLGGGDIDLVIEGDAIALAQALAAATGGAAQTHATFGTATVTWAMPDPIQLDLITARAEAYPQPAALPVVTPADLAADLGRRDFTINTLAAEIRPIGPPQLHDPYSGIADLQAGLIRVLHQRSFIDDPTRILRAARFAARLGFAIETQTAELIMAAAKAGLVQQTTPARIRNEWELLLGERAAADALELLDRLAVLPSIVPGLAWTPDLAAICRQAIARALPASQQRLLLSLVLLARLPTTARQAWARQYGLPKTEYAMVEQLGRLEAMAPDLAGPALGNGALDRALAPFADPPLEAMALLHGGRVAERIAHYQTALRPVPSALTASDLLARGVPPGPEYRRLLAEARNQQLDELGGERPHLAGGTP